MGVGVSILLIAVGAVLIWAVSGATTIGWILLIVGCVGALFSLVFWSSWGGVPRSRDRDVIVDRR
jgi:hypothetical protein